MKIIETASKIWKSVGDKLFRIKAATYTDKDGWFRDFMVSGHQSMSGIRVTNDTALQISTVFDCINAISSDVAKIPLMILRRTTPVTKEERYDHPLYNIFNLTPNTEMTAMDFRQVLTAHCLGWGNGYAEIERDIYGFPIALWILRPDRTIPKRDTNSGKIIYEVMDDTGTKTTIPAKNVFHLKGLGFDGLVGYNVIRYARESLGLAIASERFGASFFGNGSTPGGVLEHPNNLSPEA